MGVRAHFLLIFLGSYRSQTSVTPLPPHIVNFLIPETARHVVVHESCRLHVGITNGRTDELESALLECLAHCI